MNDSDKTRTKGETVEERGGEQSCMNDSDKKTNKEGRDRRRERG